jgi:hypothetical protein
VDTRSAAAVWADEQVTAVRDDPWARVALVDRTYHGPSGRAPRHLPFRRAALSFMRWQLRRGVLASARSKRPAEEPTAQAWYRAHNGSVVAAYLEHRHLAERENAAERFFMNVVLCRVLYAHALVAAPRLSLAWLGRLAPALGDPRLGMTGIFLQLSRVLPDEYPLRDDVHSYLSDELGFGRLLDFGLIVPRLRQLYEWSAHELDAPGLLECARNGALTYAWPFEDRHVWVAGRSVAISMVRRAIPAVHRRQA